MTQTDQQPAPAGSGLVTGLGILVYLASGLPFLFGGLIMPIWAVLVLGAIWLIGLLVVIRGRANRLLLFGLPFVMLGLWFLASWAGEKFLGWTA